MLTPQQQTDATVAKLSQLAQDANTKAGEFLLTSTEDAVNRAYYHGFEAGLKRAIMVVQGRG